MKHLDPAVESGNAPARVSRPKMLVPQVVFLDGLTGTGKTMMAPILATLDRMEAPRLEHTYEYVCALHFLGRMEDDAAAVMLRMHLDLACYNSMIARESNFRWRDLSGVVRNQGLRYLRRLFFEDGAQVVDRIERERPILPIVSHQALGTMNPLFESLGERLLVIEMVRHPLHLLEHWYSYIDRHGTDLRDFTVWIEHEGRQLPWFAFGWERRYIESNKMDRVILAIDWLTKVADEVRRRQGARILTVPFERFVTGPGEYLSALEQTLGTRSTRRTRKELRRQKVPRKLTTAGVDDDVYRRYGWTPPAESSTERSELDRCWQFADKEASREALDVLERMCTAYMDEYLKSVVVGVSV